MGLTSMKRDPQSRRQAETAIAAEIDEPEYPWGLNIHLEEEDLKRLGAKETFEAGEDMVMTATVSVKSFTEEDTETQGKQRRLELQITDMELKEPGKQGAADKLYGE